MHTTLQFLTIMAGLFCMSTCTQPHSAAQAIELELASPFVDDAILQRQMAVPVWGWATPTDQVTVSFAGQTKTASADKLGKWMVQLDPLEASAEARTLTVQSKIQDKAIEVQGVLVGEVWLSSGQSNMDWVAGKSMVNSVAGSLAKAGKDIPIREFQVDAGSSVFPQERVEAKAGWKRSTEADGFSALSLSFAHKLYEELGVPIGLLRSTHGATPIETWIPAEGFAAHPSLASITQKIRQSDPSTPEGKAAFEQFYEDMRQWQREGEALLNRGGQAQPLPELPGIASDWKGASRKFNKKINGFVPYAIRGMIWCQGANNFQDGRIYADKMQALVDGIRMVWDRPDLPFYFTQMQAYGSVDPDQVGYADLRQVQTLFFERNIENGVGMVVQHDMNSARPAGIHYFNKLHPGWRMARWALAHEYGRKDVAYTGPIYKSHKVEGKSVRVTFEQRGPGGKLMVGSKGLAKDYQEEGKYVEPAKPTPGDKLTHFRLAGADGKWHAAEARIDGMDVVVTSPAVPEPVGVQYAYSAVPMGANLYNEAGLPALSFAIFKGEPVFQEDLKQSKAQADTGEKPAPKPYVSIMTPFRDGAVVQRDKPVPVWGFALPGATVTVKFAGQEKSAVTDEFEHWRVTLDPITANASGRDLVVTTSDNRSLTVRDVVVGDLWVFNGSYDLTRPVVDSRNKEAAAPADLPLMREFAVRTKARHSPTPRRRRMEHGGGSRFASRWITAKKEGEGMEISSAAYRFAEQVQEKGVPLGILNLAASNPPLSWISHQGLQTAKGFEAERDVINLLYPNTESCKQAVEAYIGRLQAYADEIIALRKQGLPIPEELAERVPSFPRPPYSTWDTYTETATHTYNWLIAPNSPMAVKGVVWIPGKSNLGKDVARYAPALEAYAASLPATYGQEQVTFVYAQPAVPLMKSEAAEGAGTIRLPEIGKAIRVDFDQWPTDQGEIASKLGAAAK